MAIWTIEVLNDSGGVKSYAVLAAPPEVTQGGRPVPVHSTAWIPFDYVEPGDRGTATFSEAVYALFTWPVTLAPKVVVPRGFTQAVNPVARDLITIKEMGRRSMSAVPTPGAAPPDSFSIFTEADFPADGPVVLGMSKLGAHPSPTPVAAFAAQPHVTFDIKPGARFHVVEGRYVRGKVIDIARTPNAVIDFAGREKAVATVTQGADGAFTVVYGQG